MQRVWQHLRRYTPSGTPAFALIAISAAIGILRTSKGTFKHTGELPGLLLENGAAGKLPFLKQRRE